MLTCTTKDGKEIKLKNKEFKKYFAAAQAERVLAEVMKALKENAKELEADGHSVIPPEHYILDVKLPSEFVFSMTRKHYSDYSDFKGTLTNSKYGVMDYVFGVNNLEMLEKLAYFVGWTKGHKETYSNMFGRGSAARVAHKNILEQAASITNDQCVAKYVDPADYAGK